MTIRFYVSVMALVLSGVMAVMPVAYAEQENASEIKHTDDFPVLEKLRGGDDKLQYDYLGDKYGLDAWLLSGPELMQIIYVLPQDKTAIVGGTLVNPDGKEASSTLLQDFLKQNPLRAAEILQHVRDDQSQDVAAIPPEKNVAPQGKNAAPEKSAAQKATLSPAEKFWHELDTIGGISFGTNKDAPEIFAVLDPAQTDTQLVWSILNPLAEKGHLRLRVIPLAATTADSIMDVAYVLGGENPAQAWIDLLGGKKPDATGTPETHGVLRMKAIVELAQAMNLRQLPLLVYRTDAQQGKAGTVRIIRGTPKNWVSVFGEMGMADAAVPKGTKTAE